MKSSGNTSGREIDTLPVTETRPTLVVTVRVRAAVPREACRSRRRCRAGSGRSIPGAVLRPSPTRPPRCARRHGGAVGLGPVLRGRAVLEPVLGPVRRPASSATCRSGASTCRPRRGRHRRADDTARRQAGARDRVATATDPLRPRPVPMRTPRYDVRPRGGTTVVRVNGPAASLTRRVRYARGCAAYGRTRRCEDPRPLLGDRRSPRRDAARRAGRRRREGGAARRRPVPRVQRVRGLEPVPSLGHDRPQDRAGREAFVRLVDDADVLVETFRPGVTDRLGIGYDALHAREPAPRLPVVPRIPGGPPPRRPSRLRRARAGEQRPAVGAAGLADGTDLPAHADAEHGRVLPDPERHPRRAHRTGGDRARPARDDVAVPGRAALHDPDLAAGREGAGGVPRPHGQELPARHPPADALRGARTSSGCTRR